ncbi:CDK-activating kinase assembly factor MAT1 [Polytolypa hystricis UAMH7299]|uniref:RNA polymerase II transcription factor B subunit 3 n=1 Tax=Polytolypa hystricis (strain UAMH7299) TaxID=1447883 RepID=A0A2B7Z450_POLH7|nr:CDK-activating kinase assembly factor MAT1 [Polytolypa hystricis UAMH7299]
MSPQPNGTRHHRPGEEDGEPLHIYLSNLSISTTTKVCPVCKSSRYLNPDMRFLINPECYHKMCESCVDRIFSAGPAPCPVAGCHRTLRKHRFRKQTFEDINVEKEVDIRKRVMQILNRREEEFATKLDFDNFLEQREDIISSLLSGTNVPATEAQLRSYATQNATSIRANKVLEAQESASFLESQTQEQEAIRLRREAARQDYESERAAIAQGREDVISRLATGDVADAQAVARETSKKQQVLLKKSSARRSEEERIKRKQASLLSDSKRTHATTLANAPGSSMKNAALTGTSFIKGLKRIATPEPEAPYDPFMSFSSLESRDYYTLLPSYPSQYLDHIRDDSTALAGGYDLQEYYARTILSAFAGLGCFIDEEVGGETAATTLNAASRASPTDMAASAAGSTPVAATAAADDDDVF